MRVLRALCNRQGGVGSAPYGRRESGTVAVGVGHFESKLSRTSRLLFVARPIAADVDADVGAGLKAGASQRGRSASALCAPHQSPARTCAASFRT